MKELMLGNEAVARGLYEAGVMLVSSYPGTPSTEITEYAAAYKEISSEWATNEKVAAETAFGAALGGCRAFTAMKHVGLNVAADLLYTASYTGVGAGFVLAVADDPGMHSSQNEQDSRHHARGAKVPMLEPNDSQECLDYIKLAFDLSERFDTPVMVRLTTRIAHARSLVRTGERVVQAKRRFVRNIPKYVMMPQNARPRHEFVEQRMQDLREWAESAAINEMTMHDTDVGVITSGACYQYAREALGKTASYLKLGLVHPLPTKLIQQFASKVRRLVVIEELDPVIEDHCRALGLQVQGKELFPLCGELSQRVVRAKTGRRQPAGRELAELLPPRPPVMCAGCPHRGTFWALKQAETVVLGDIGCYSLGATPPLSIMDTCISMGAAVGSAHGFSKVRDGDEGKPAAVIGDSTFVHSGITGLINLAYNQGNALIVILDNSTTGMTGHQQNPATGITLRGEHSVQVDLEALCRSVGISRVRVADPYDLPGMVAAVREELAFNGPSVLIARRPCALLKSVRHGPALQADPEQCTGCKSCLRIGCPAISVHGRKARIDPTQCVGCTQCVSLCKFGAIKEGGDNE